MIPSRVQQFTKDGKFLAAWGRHGGGEGEFDMPWGICLDRKGDVYVTDWTNHRLQVFGPDGTFVTSSRSTTRSRTSRTLRWICSETAGVDS